MEGQERGSGAATTIILFCSYSGFKCALSTDDVFCQRIVTTWPVSHAGWPSVSGPAGLTLEGHLANFARCARGPIRCQADRLPDLRLSAPGTWTRLPGSRSILSSRPSDDHCAGFVQLCIIPVLQLCNCFRAVGCFVNRWSFIETPWHMAGTRRDADVR